MNTNIKTIIKDVIQATQMQELPTTTQKEYMHIFSQDIDPTKDWDDFIGGQKVMHTYYEKSYKVDIDLESLEFGNSYTSFYSLFQENTTMELYTTDYIDVNGKMIAIGNKLDQKFMAISYQLHNFSNKRKDGEKLYRGKIVLVNVEKYLSELVDDNSIAPTINIVDGKIGETIKLPQLVIPETGFYDVDELKIETVEKTIPKVKAVEIFYTDPRIGFGTDFVSNTDSRNGSLNRKLTIEKATTKPKYFPIQYEYCIVPTQFQIPSIDNYGFSHPADKSNTAKVLAATQQLGSAAGNVGGGLSGALGKVVSSSVGLGQMFFGDKGTLANSGAVVASFPQSDSDAIKFFVQPAGMEDGSPIENGILDFTELTDDYLEINQANGQFGKYGKAMSPSNNNGFNDYTYWRTLGLNTVNKPQDTITALAAPYGASTEFIINDDKIENHLKFGVVRQEITGTLAPNFLRPSNQFNDWQFYIRNMFFRPDPFTFWNWPLIMPAEIGIYDTRKATSISYDTAGGELTADMEKVNVAEQGIFGAAKTFISNVKDEATLVGNTLKDAYENYTNPSSNTTNLYWNKTITLDQITNNDFYDPNKTFTSFRYELENTDDFYQIHDQAFQAGVAQVKLIDENDKVIREHKFNSQGKNVGTSASILSVWEI